MTPFLTATKRILLRSQVSWSCLTAAIYAPLRLRHSQDGKLSFFDSQLGKKSHEMSSAETATLSNQTLHRYIARDIHLANLELNELMEQEGSTKSLSVEQLGITIDKHNKTKKFRAERDHPNFIVVISTNTFNFICFFHFPPKELRGLAIFDLHLDPTFLQQERGGYSVRQVLLLYSLISRIVYIIVF